MTNLLIIACVLIALTVVVYLIFNNKDKDEPTQTTQYTPEELENIKLAEELYNKDLRPVVTKKAKPQVAEELNIVEPEFVAKEPKPEFPIDKPKKKRKYYPKKKKQ
jgi:hypothetical protein